MSILKSSSQLKKGSRMSTAIQRGIVRRTRTIWHFLLGRQETLFLYRPDKVVQGPVQVQTGCMLNLIRDSWTVDIIEDGSLRKHCENYAVESCV